MFGQSALRIIAVLSLSVFLAACDALKPPEPAPLRLTPVATSTPTPQPTPNAAERQTQRVIKGTLVRAIQAGGSLIPAKQIPINPPTAGILVELRVKQGDAVKEGDVLGKIAVQDAESKRLQAQQALTKAKIDLAQARAEPPNLQSQLTEAQLKVEQLKIELAKKEREDFDKELAKAKRDLDRAQARAKDLRYFWEQVKWKNTPDVWALGGQAEAAEDAADKAEEAYQQLLDSKEFRQRELDLLKQQLASAQQDVATLQQTADLQKQAYDLRLQLLQAAVDDAQRVLDEITNGIALRAPISGMVTAVNASPGDPVDPNHTILTLADPKVAKAAVNLAESDVVNIAIGQSATVQIPALGDTNYEAKVTWIATTASAQQGKDPTFQVILDVLGLDGRAKVGMTANANIVTGKKENVLLVPNAAVRTRSGQRFVEVVDGATTKEVPVQVGDRNSTQTEILAGLQEGQIVIVGVPLR